MNEHNKILTFDDKLDISKEDTEFIKSICDKKAKEGIHFRPHTKVDLYTNESGEMKLKWSKCNMMTLAGGGFIARTLFDVSNAELTPDYNNELGLDNTISSTSAQTSPIKVFGFIVGTDWCGREASQVRAPYYHGRINPNWESAFGQQWGGIVPFQFRPSDADLTAEERHIYYGRQTLSDYYAYYVKSFDSEPIMSQVYTDGSPIDSSVYETATDLGVITTVTMTMSITKDDCRDWFYFGNNGLTLNDARINAISLVMGWPYNPDDDDFTYYQSIRPLTLLSFPNESIIDLRKSITIKYTLYL